nr:MAG TPA: hypothetical protein [Caudoviricetes sp.]
MCPYCQNFKGTYRIGDTPFAHRGRVPRKARYTLYRVLAILTLRCKDTTILRYMQIICVKSLIVNT